LYLPRELQIHPVLEFAALAVARDHLPGEAPEGGAGFEAGEEGVALRGVGPVDRGVAGAGGHIKEVVVAVGAVAVGIVAEYETVGAPAAALII
jgi:hypothetical protein